jgi:hypothetical protein
MPFWVNFYRAQRKAVRPDVKPVPSPPVVAVCEDTKFTSYDGAMTPTGFKLRSITSTLFAKSQVEWLKVAHSYLKTLDKRHNVYAFQV